MSACWPPRVTWCIYILIFFDIVGGMATSLHAITMLIHDEFLPETFISAFTLPMGVMSIILGSLLWIGYNKGNDVYLFAYLIIKAANLTYLTLALLILVSLVDASTGTFFSILTTLIIVWSIHYGVYVYYKDLVNSTTSMNPANVVVSYDNTRMEDTKMEEAVV